MKKSTRSSIEFLESRIAPATFAVTTLKDSTDANHDTGSLRDAIFLADTAGGNNTIVFEKVVGSQTAPLIGTIILTSNLPTITDNLIITGPVSGKANDLVINGHGHAAIMAQTGTGGLTMSDLTITHAATTSGGGGVYLEGNGTFSLTDVTITGNRAIGVSGETSFGGGIEIAGGTTVTISHSKITGNVNEGFNGTATSGAKDAYGGGIFCRGTLTLSSSIISGNTARGGSAKAGSSDVAGAAAYGGGIYCSHNGSIAGSVTVEDDCVIANNKVVGGNGVAGAKGGSGSAGSRGGDAGDASGGGIYCYKGDVTVTASVISGNSARAGHAGAGGAGGAGADGGNGGTGGFAYGGGVVCNGTAAEVTIVTSTISGNTIAATKGGVGGAAGSHGVKGSTGFSGFAYGGGINSRESLTVSQSTIAKNVGTFGGGIALLKSAVAMITDSTIAQNSAVDGGGLEVQGTATADVYNDTIAQNIASKNGGGIDNFTSSFLNVISTIIAKNTALTDADITGKINASFDLIGKVTPDINFGTNTSNLLNQNPLLGTLGLHGGTTETMLPSIKVGKISPVINAGSNPDLLTVDQRGDPREINGSIDIGAVELG